MKKWHYIEPIQFPNLISKGVLRATLITFCFVLADDLHINILKFVAGHSAAVQPAPIISYLDVNKHNDIIEVKNISIGFYQSCQWECTTCWIALVARAYHSYSRTLLFLCILCVGYSAIWCLVQVAQCYKDDKYFSCTFPLFEKATNLFNAIGHHASSLTPAKISIDILLPAAKTFGLKLA